MPDGRDPSPYLGVAPCVSLPGRGSVGRPVPEGGQRMSLREEAQAIQADLVELRRALHREPEIGSQLPLTQAKVLAALDGLPLEISTGTELSSVTAVLRGGRPGPAVLLRSDMDALPVDERSGEPFA